MPRPRKIRPSADAQWTLESQVIASSLKTLLEKHKLKPAQLARNIEVAHSQIYGLLNGEPNRNMTAVLALKLARYFNQDPLHWMTLQARVDLAVAMEQHGDKVAAIKPHAERPL